MADNTIKSIQFKRGTKLALETVLKGINKPLLGEPIWESDTNKLKLGNGKDDYVDLPYISGSDIGDLGLVIVGWYKDNGFYQEESCINLYPRYTTKIYYDNFTTNIYYYSEDSLYHRLVQDCQVDSGLAGLVKLYNNLGQNEDGAVTQYLFTQKYQELLYDKIGIDRTELHEECINFVVTERPKA